MNATVFRQIFDWFIELGYLEEEDIDEFYEDLSEIQEKLPRFYNMLKDAADR